MRNGDIILDLASPEQLFSADSHDPFDPGFTVTSGIERVLAELGARRAGRRRDARLVLRMPGEILATDPGPRLGAAIRRYCAARRADVALRRAATWQEGLQTLYLATGFIVICVILSVALEHSSGLGEFARRLLGDGLVIAGWVALWRPLDMLLYETWLLRREKRVIDAVAEMPVVLEPRPVS